MSNTELADSLVEKARDRSAVFGVIGLGYVGLPLAVEIAEAGFRVVGFDLNQAVVDTINGGKSHIQDVDSETLKGLVEKGLIEATTDNGRMPEVDLVSICVPTPLSKTKDPDVSYVVAAADAVAKNLRPGQVIVLESTTYPGTTRDLLLPRMEDKGLVVGESVFLAFSPERVDPGNETWQTRNTPKVVGTVTPECARVVLELYGPVFETLVPVSSPEAAELVKLLENTFRSVNIGLANEMAIVCDKLGVDVWEVIDAAATKPFGFMKFTPGPGLGGHCIPIDPHYLAWKMRGLNYKTRFVDLAGEVNSEMPLFWSRKVGDALNEKAKSVRGANILVLGVAYKKNIDDMRESPAIDIVSLLSNQGAEIKYHDPYVPSFMHEGIELQSVEFNTAVLNWADCIVIATDHGSVDYSLLKNSEVPIVDTRNVLGNS